MKKKNKIIINQETMVQAIQYWLNNDVLWLNHKTTVVSIKTKYGNMPNTFEIETNNGETNST
jgi:hypothetical protein